MKIKLTQVKSRKKDNLDKNLKRSETKNRENKGIFHKNQENNAVNRETLCDIVQLIQNGI